MSVIPKELFISNAISGVSGDIDIAGGAGSTKAGVRAMGSAVMGYFTSEGRRFPDIASMLEGSKERDKLEAMKKLIGLISSGEDVSEHFPNVVKNVVSSSVEVKKLVYIYLARYAEQQPDLALLSINTFQRDLKDQNQFIRASALRVLSNIRVPVIVPIVALAIKTVMTDSSPYVRKTAAHAIPKLYCVDPDQKEVLVGFIETLLGDNSTLVVGSVIMAFEEVCPERLDLLHKHFRKLCTLLVDVDEWGQIAILQVLLRYGRTQFVNPNASTDLTDQQKPFYSSKEDDSDASFESKETISQMDPDHRYLLTASKQLLQHRNSGTVLAVALLFYYLAPYSEAAVAGRALVRIMRNSREIQFAVLRNIAIMSKERPSLFSPFLKKFYIVSSDPIFTRVLKLEILTNIASESTITSLFLEFQTYVRSNDETFAAATIQAIGKCAARLPDVVESCLNGLIKLISSRNEAVISESIVVLKKLMQTHKIENSESLLLHLARKIDHLSVPIAKAHILWLLGEYSSQIPRVSPDVLRRFAKSFSSEEDVVKMQIINLAAKMYVLNYDATHLLFQYVMNQAKYDMNYDIRDRARFLKNLLQNDENSQHPSPLKDAQLRQIFFTVKPAPSWDADSLSLSKFNLGSLSMIVNLPVVGYQPLPDFPDTPPDPSVRIVDSLFGNTPTVAKTFPTPQLSSFSKFYDDDDDDDDEESESESATNSSSDADSGSENDEDDEEESGSDSDSCDTESSSNNSQKRIQTNSSTDILLDLESPSIPSPEILNQSQAILNPSIPTPTKSPFSEKSISPQALQPSKSSQAKIPSWKFASCLPLVNPKKFPLLNRLNSCGLSIQYSFNRRPSLVSESFIGVTVFLHNTSSQKIQNICFQFHPQQSDGLSAISFPEIPELQPQSQTEEVVHLNFNDTLQPLKFDILIAKQSYPAEITAPVGELIRCIECSLETFLHHQSQLSGMNESCATFSWKKPCENDLLTNLIIANVNVAKCGINEKSKELLFAGVTYSKQHIVLIRALFLQDSSQNASQVRLIVNSDSLSIGSNLLQDLKTALLV